MASLTGDPDIDKLLNRQAPGSTDPISDESVIDRLMRSLRDFFRPDAMKSDPGAQRTRTRTPTSTPSPTPNPQAQGPMGGQQGPMGGQQGPQFAVSPESLDQADQMAIQQLQAQAQRGRTGFSV
jgi:hypothetical protein